MTISFTNKYLQSLCDNLITAHETEINYLSLEVTLDPKQINENDIKDLLSFVTDSRNRLFLFKWPDNEEVSKKLAFVARRAYLNQIAKINLQKTATEPKINPLKKDLNTPPKLVRAPIQIQRSFALPKQLASKKIETKTSAVQQKNEEEIILIPLALDAHLVILEQQLYILGITQLQDTALQKIKEHAHAFTDGIIPNNLPKGFYIDPNKNALCYTNAPTRLPSALAPVLEKLPAFDLPTAEQAKDLLPAVIHSTIEPLLTNSDQIAQKNALQLVVPEMAGLFSLLKPDESDFMIPLFAKMFILGGESHTQLFAQLIKIALNKKININFLKDPEAQKAFFNPRGIKNLQKLVQLPAEQRDWWKTLATAHLQNSEHHFDFNNFFEAYTQIFLPQIKEKNLTLPQPCPIEHTGHLLITLNRVLDVLEKSQNPQEQCFNLANLNWSPAGVHYAMTQAPEDSRFRQVAACMKLDTPKATQVNLKMIHEQIKKPSFDLKPWLFRYLGQHWRPEIRLADIQEQFNLIETMPEWSAETTQHLLFIVTSSFAEEAEITVDRWKKTIRNCLNSLQSIEAHERDNLVQALANIPHFKPIPSLLQIQKLITLCLDLKSALPEQNFQEDLVKPLTQCLENEGYDFLDAIQERVHKVDKTPKVAQSILIATHSLLKLLQANRQQLSPEFITLLAALNEPQLTQTQIDGINLSLKNLQEQKGKAYTDALLALLTQINISKSQFLPDAQHIEDLMKQLGSATDSVPENADTPEKQQAWMQKLLLDKNLLPGCVIGNGDISKLDDLIIEALCEAIKKRSGILNIKGLKTTLSKHLQNGVIPQQLKDQLNRELWPLLDALDELVTSLQQPNPKFDDIIKKFEFFEQNKRKLLDAHYKILIGESKGEYIFSYMLTGKRKDTDNLTNGLFASVLSLVYDLITNELRLFFADEHNDVEDLDEKTTLSWLTTFNDTHSITFLFRQELVNKKVFPAIKKTLAQLHTEDPEFEASILNAAADLAENKPSDIALKEYKARIESIVHYLNLLIEIKAKAAAQFTTIYKQFNSGALARLNFVQKQILITNLLKADFDAWEHYLKLAATALDENPEAEEIAITRAMDGLTNLFQLDDLDPETKAMFFKMSMVHNLKSSSPFPLATINALQKSNLDEKIKSAIIKQIIQVLSYITNMSSPELVQNLVQQTQVFLMQNPTHASLCKALLKCISSTDSQRDINAYANILICLSSLPAEHREKLTIILNNLAQNHKDDSVNLSLLHDITRGLGRRVVDLEQVLQLFATPPYPMAQKLNAVLLAHGSEKLQAYCQNFDSNPFAKPGEARAVEKQFATNRIQEALLNLKDLMREESLPPTLLLQLARQLTYIEILGYTDPLKPHDYQGLKKLTACSRTELKAKAGDLLKQMRDKTLPAEHLEQAQLELLATLREIYFRATGLFPNSTQMLVLLLSLQEPYTNLLLRIKTGEGKSLITPMLAVLQWAQSGTVDVCTANNALLLRDYENSCEPFFNFLGIKSALIHSNSLPEDYQLDGINCSTVENMSLFRLATKEAKKENLIQNDQPIHLVLDESDDALLDQTTLYKLVEETAYTAGDNPAQWIYPLAYEFINLPIFRNIDPSKGKIWDEEDDIEQFRLFINKEINERFNGDADKQNFIMSASSTQLKQWIQASCKAAMLIENNHFIICPVKEKDETGNEITKKIVCVPLVKSIPKTGCIFTDGVQQALQARLIAEHKDQAHYIFIDPDPHVLASQSSLGLVRFYQDSKGRILGLSGTPGDSVELQYLSTLLGTQALGIDPHAGDLRKEHAPIFTYSKEETIQAIHQAVNRIKRPVTKPKIEFDPNLQIETFEDHEKFIDLAKDAQKEWNKTQTQPILIISENFNESQKIAQSFDSYKNAGFTIQVVTGKESAEERDKMIKKAGRANTITVGTAMLGRGIDVNPEDHPQGLSVIQVYPDSKRITEQFAGRAARNGKPGEWQPIYQIDPPQNWFQKIVYFIFPWHRQRKNQETIARLQDEIKTQATVDRLYTQAIDQVQKTLMNQVEAWENILLELNPADAYELYQWRETLLNELTQIQETHVTQETLVSCNAQFQSSVCKLWETAREEKWLVKAQKATQLSAGQTLKLNYLKRLDLSEELKIQTALEQKSQPFKKGAKTLMHYNLGAIILDKAGAALEYTQADEQEKKELELAQSKQLLPFLIGELFGFYPEAVQKLAAGDKPKTAFFILDILFSFIEKVKEQKNKVLLGAESLKQMTQSMIQSYQNELKDADAETIKAYLEKIKPLILIDESVAKLSLVDKFKMQGLILNFHMLYERAGLKDKRLTDLKIRYSTDIMHTLATHLIAEFAWVKEKPVTFHAFFERTVAKEAALELHKKARKVMKNPYNEQSFHELYACLQQHRINLQDKYLFSIGHSNPRGIINMALMAIESLQIPQCSPELQVNMHDKVLSTHYLTQFHQCLDAASDSVKKPDPVWEHLQKILATQSKANENDIHVLIELQETVNRFSTYTAYQPYKHQLRMMKAELVHSVTLLRKSDGLKQDADASLFSKKTLRIADVLGLDKNQVRIQSSHDSLHSYIELQIENAPLIEGFSGYISPSHTQLQHEKNHLLKQKQILRDKQEGLLALTDLDFIETLSEIRSNAFKKLINQKELLSKNWSEILDETIIQELPKEISSLYTCIQRAQAWNWLDESIDIIKLKTVFPGKLSIPAKLYEEYFKFRKELTDLKGEEQKIIADLNEKTSQNEVEKKKNENSNTLMSFISNLYQHDLSGPKKALTQLKFKEQELLTKLEKSHLLLNEAQQEFILAREAQAKILLETYIEETGQGYITEMEQELDTAEATLGTLTQVETKKSRYQKQRFSSIAELLKYEASLIKEEEKIPAQKAPEAIRLSSFKTSLKTSVSDHEEPLLTPGFSAVL